MKSPNFSTASAQEVLDFLMNYDDPYHRLSDDEFKQLIPIITDVPEVAEYFFSKVLLPVARKEAKKLNRIFPLIPFTANEVANMAHTGFMAKGYKSLESWNMDCCWQFWISIVYPQRLRQEVMALGLSYPSSKKSKKDNHLNLLSLPEDERLCLIELLPDDNMVALLKAIYVDRYDSAKIEKELGMDPELQNRTHEAAAKALRVTIEEDYRGAVYFNRNGKIVNIAKKLFPTKREGSEVLNGYDVVSIDAPEVAELATREEGADVLADVIEANYPGMDRTCAISQFVHDCIDMTNLSPKERFVLERKLAGYSSAQIADDYEAETGSRILTSNVDNCKAVAVKKLTITIKIVIKHWGGFE